ncbi:conserved protein of unknown function [Candidatus Filomicrobium marinum]|uniref:Outer membrane protein beta-barrel domain-containing protein n=1 Tax=Candidatus Filomicrobium marinum TaxID=1608628 RepID=A0A0D6JE75_9HYPH|nr:hypothetical protein [Candidatus Filomicrobium marinum]CFX13573.1 conserved protein of unknown function [Candidatus Filomicrobium marinum]CPR17627.1 conserved protein of unknown function [Candidatus Filomicrobium marinum]
MGSIWGIHALPNTYRLSELVWPRPAAPSAASGWFETGSRALAILALAVWVGAGVWQSDAGEPERVASDTPQAATPKTKSSAPTAEYMVAAYGGMPYTYDSQVNLKKAGQHDFSAEPVAWRGEPFIDPIYYGVRVLRWFGEGRTGTMLDFTHSKTIAELQNDAKFKGLLNGSQAPEVAKLNDVFKRLEFSHGHNMLTLNGLLRLANLHPRLSPYVGLGAGINLPHTEIQLQSDKRRTYEYQFTGPVVQALVGLEFRLPRMSYFLEYKFSFASYDVPLTGLDGTKIGLFADLYRQAMRWFSGEEPAQGRLTTELASHQVIGGLGVRFAVRPAAAATP